MGSLHVAMGSPQAQINSPLTTKGKRSSSRLYSHEVILKPASPKYTEDDTSKDICTVRSF